MILPLSNSRLYESKFSLVNKQVAYGYDDQFLTHQPRVVYDTVASESYNLYWNLNGNLQEISNCKFENVRFHSWDEENRLRAMIGPKSAGLYGYDGNGNRVWKLTGDCRLESQNGGEQEYSAYFDDAVLYPNPYLTITPQGYTKHYYLGQERVATALGEGGWELSPEDLNMREIQNAQSYLEHLSAKYLFGKITDPNVDNVDAADNYPTELQYDCLPFQLAGLSLSGNKDIFYECITTYYHPSGYAEDVYYTHSNHLGSASWITDVHGDPIQYIHYAPYGELLASQHAYGSSYDERYKFTGKERDAETGYDFYGARYQIVPLGIWGSPDPLLDKYIFASPNMYCNGNPIKYVDPDGRWVQLVVGALIGGASDYAFQVGMNMVNGDDFSTALTHDISLGSIAFSAAAGAVGAGLAKNVNKAQQAVKLANNAQKANKATRVLDNAKKGAEFERKVGQSLGKNKASQVTIKVKDGTKTRMDFVSIEDGNIKLTEAKSSATAPLTPNQKTAHPQIEQYGGTIKGNNGNNIGLPNGTEIPPTKVDIVRPNNLTD